MSKAVKIFPDEKNGLHPRNPHRFRYDFTALITTCPALASFVTVNQYKNQSVNFADPAAVKMLNKALLQHFYKIKEWDIPAGYLCPPVPGRADYIHYLTDLLNKNEKQHTAKEKINILDIGTGANGIYPLIGHAVYDWNFVGTDIDPVAIQSLQKVLAVNNISSPAIECRLQKNASKIFDGIIKPEEYFTATMCNPPFHTSLQEANEVALRKQRNLGKEKYKKPVLNFGGQSAELYTAGGELAFIKTMINESILFAKNVGWFTTLVSKKDNLPMIYAAIKKAGAADITTISMAQGQKNSRFVGWRF